MAARSAAVRPCRGKRRTGRYQPAPDAGSRKSVVGIERSVVLVNGNVPMLTCPLREAGGERLSHRDKLALVEVLNAKGIFMMKGAVKYVADKLGCSQTTIYRYLNRMNGAPDGSEG